MCNCGRRCCDVSLLREGTCSLLLVLQQHILASAHLAHMDLMSLKGEAQALQGTTAPLSVFKLLLEACIGTSMARSVTET